MSNPLGAGVNLSVEGNMEDALNNIGKALDRITTQLGDTSKVMQEVSKSTKGASGQFDELSKGINKVAESTAAMRKNLDFSSLMMVGGQYRQFGESLSTGAGAIAIGAAKLAKSVWDTGKEFESYKSQLATIFKETEVTGYFKTDAELDKIRKLARLTPFVYSELVQASTLWRVYGQDPFSMYKYKNPDFKADQPANENNKEYLERELILFAGDLAGATGRSLGDAQAALIRAMNDNWRSMQLTFGMSKVLVEQKIGRPLSQADDEQGRLDRLAGLVQFISENYGGGMERLAQTTEGIISNLEDAWTAFKKEVADVGAFDDVRKSLKGVLDLADKLSEDGDEINGKTNTFVQFSQIVGQTYKEMYAPISKVIDMVTKGSEHLAKNMAQYPTFAKALLSVPLSASTGMFAIGKGLSGAGSLLSAISSIVVLSLQIENWSRVNNIGQKLSTFGKARSTAKSWVWNKIGTAGLDMYDPNASGLGKVKSWFGSGLMTRASSALEVAEAQKQMNLWGFMLKAFGSFFVTLLKIVSVAGLLYVAWKFNFFGIQTAVQNWSKVVTTAFRQVEDLHKATTIEEYAKKWDVLGSAAKKIERFLLVGEALSQFLFKTPGSITATTAEKLDLTSAWDTFMKLAMFAYGVRDIFVGVALEFTATWNNYVLPFLRGAWWVIDKVLTTLTGGLLHLGSLDVSNLVTIGRVLATIVEVIVSVKLLTGITNLILGIGGIASSLKGLWVTLSTDPIALAIIGIGVALTWTAAKMGVFSSAAKDIKEALLSPANTGNWGMPMMPTNTDVSGRLTLQDFNNTQANVLNIPAFAQGGTVTKPTLALVGEDGPETIIPLTKPNRAKELWNQTGDTLNLATAPTGFNKVNPSIAPVLEFRNSEKLNAASRDLWTDLRKFATPKMDIEPASRYSKLLPQPIGFEMQKVAIKPKLLTMTKETDKLPDKVNNELSGLISSLKKAIFQDSSAAQLMNYSVWVDKWVGSGGSSAIDTLTRAVGEVRSSTKLYDDRIPNISGQDLRDNKKLQPILYPTVIERRDYDLISNVNKLTTPPLEMMNPSINRGNIYRKGAADEYTFKFPTKLSGNAIALTPKLAEFDSYDAFTIGRMTQLITSQYSYYERTFGKIKEDIEFTVYRTFKDIEGMKLELQSFYSKQPLLMDKKGNILSDKPPVSTYVSYQDIVKQAASKYKVEPWLLNELISQTSNWNYDYAKDQRLGLMGLTSNIVKSLGYDLQVYAKSPELQVEVGANYLSKLFYKTKDWGKALDEYYASVNPSTNLVKDMVERQSSSTKAISTPSFSDKLADMNKFRLPSLFGIPAMPTRRVPGAATGGYTPREGLINMHPGEVILNAKQVVGVLDALDMQKETQVLFENALSTLEDTIKTLNVASTTKPMVIVQSPPSAESGVSVGELHVHFELPNVRAMNDLDHAAVSRIAEMLVDEIRIQKVKDDLVKHRNVS